MDTNNGSAGKKTIRATPVSVRTCSQCKGTGHDKRTCRKTGKCQPAGFSTPLHKSKSQTYSRRITNASRKTSIRRSSLSVPFGALDGLDTMSPIKGPVDLDLDLDLKTPVPVRTLKRTRTALNGSTKTARAKSTITGSNNSNKSPATKRSALPPPTPRTEEQAHGLTWEKDILMSVFGVSREDLKTRKSTAKFDLDGRHNTLNPGTNLSIKVSGSNVINMGDCQRVFDVTASGIPIHVIVIQYKQYRHPDVKRVKRITEMNLTGAKQLLFGDMTKAQIQKLDNSIKSLPRCTYPSASNKTNLGSIKKSISGSLRATRLDIKCSTKQRRLQFSIRNWSKFIADNPTLVISDSHTNEFRGGVIRHKLDSGPRGSNKESAAIEIPVDILENSHIHLPDDSMLEITED